MSFTILPDTFTVTTDGDGVRCAVIDHIVRASTDMVVRVHTIDDPDGRLLVVLDHEPDHLHHHLYGVVPDTADGAIPDDPFPVIPYGRITAIHIY